MGLQLSHTIILVSVGVSPELTYLGIAAINVVPLLVFRWHGDTDFRINFPPCKIHLDELVAKIAIGHNRLWKFPEQ